MHFNSLTYVFVFLPVVVAGWALLRTTRFGNLFIAAASLYFYASAQAWYLLPLFVTALLDYYIGRKVYDSQSERWRKRLVIWSVAANLALLAVFKYTTWLTTSLSGWLAPLGVTIPVIMVVLPPAISFYTFQSMSYTIDIYRREFHPYRNVVDYVSFVTFFPHLVAGPIMRARDLLPQLARNRPLPSAQTVSLAIFMILFGLFQKTVLADNAGGLVEAVIQLMGPGSQTPLPPGLGLIFAYAFAIQIYCDFAAYSTIARGSAKLVNVELMRNFLTPYFATGPSEFWRRWHISLSTWLRDYLYVPLGGNRGPWWFVMRNLMLTMLLGGLWHGAGILFILWGAWHGLLLIAYRVFPLDEWLGRFGFWGRVLAAIIFFHLVCIGWIFFRATPEQLGPIWSSIVATPMMIPDILEKYAQYIPSAGAGVRTWISFLLGVSVGLVQQNWYFFVFAWGLVLFATPVFVFDYIARRRNVEFPDLFDRMSLATKVALSLALLYGIIFFARRQANDFIYFAF
jgi:alginate O-acetyltransferase complex protein AlgI